MHACCPLPLAAPAGFATLALPIGPSKDVSRAIRRPIRETRRPSPLRSCEHARRLRSLRRPESRIRPATLRPLRARLPGRLQLQAALLLSQLPSEEGPAIRRIHPPPSRPKSSPSANCRHHPQAAQESIPVRPPTSHQPLPNRLAESPQRHPHKTRNPAGQPGVVIAIQTFGDYLNYHPHLHILITDGAFVGSHTFHALHRGDWEQVAELPFASFLDGIVYDGEWGDTSGSPSEHDARRQDLDESQETSFQYDFDQRPPPQWEEDQWDQRPIADPAVPQTLAGPDIDQRYQ